MAKSRMNLHNIFISILGTQDDEETRVYFQPPPSVDLKYPCIIYDIDDFDSKHANNKLYIGTVAYSVTVIDWDPDSEIYKKILELPMCTYDRGFAVEGLNHNILLLYY